jgi:hypothetical protein
MSQQQQQQQRRKKRKKYDASQIPPPPQFSPQTLPLFRQCMTPEMLKSIRKSRAMLCSNVVDVMASEDCAHEVVVYYFLVGAAEAEMELRSNNLMEIEDEWKASHRFADCRLLFGVEKFFSERSTQILARIQSLQDEENRYGSLDDKQKRLMDALQCSLAKFAKMHDFSKRHSSQEFHQSINDQSMKLFLQTMFFLFLTHCTRIRELVCNKQHKLRFENHTQYGSFLTLGEFFNGLSFLTKQYMEFQIDEKLFVFSVRSLSLTGMLTQNK